MQKMLVFDMDGTIADFYSVKNWMEYLDNFNPFPYISAPPLYDMEELGTLLRNFQKRGWKIAVTSWTSKNGNNKEVRNAKIQWLKKYNFPYDEIHIVKYGTTKANCTRNKADFQILVDDNKKVRDGWKLGGTIDANCNILETLNKLFTIL